MASAQPALLGKITETHQCLHILPTTDAKTILAKVALLRQYDVKFRLRNPLIRWKFVKVCILGNTYLKYSFITLVLLVLMVGIAFHPHSVPTACTTVRVSCTHISFCFRGGIRGWILGWYGCSYRTK